MGEIDICKKTLTDIKENLNIIQKIQFIYVILNN